MCLARKKVFQLLSPHSRNRIRKKNPNKCFSRGTRIWLIVSRWFMSFFSFFLSFFFFFFFFFCSGLWKENHTAGLELVVVMSFVVVAVVKPYCYYYLRVLYFANFCDLEKIAKLSARKNFYRHIITVVYAQSQTVWCWPLLERMLTILFWSFLPFLFFLPVPSRAWESDIFWCQLWEFHEQNLNFVLDG